jgi:UDP-N-acetylglucosamine diphosphorylase / glucose-1-phosphate thymidylyltransferase / UDP-N-acetylgalactosamine diphosphorylase / glucosamine-1-phosphate N-acetyltransferase / galactosamine-1-phosphate N-acetyltransferase
MADSVCIFEDEGAGRFLPLTYVRPVYDLRCGMTTLQEKIFRAYPRAVRSLHCRSSLAGVVRERMAPTTVNQPPGSRCLFLNGRVIAGNDLARKMPLGGSDRIYLSQDGTLIAARVTPTADTRSLLSNLWDRLTGGHPITASDFPLLPSEQVDVRLVTYPWDLVNANGRQISEDFAVLLKEKKIKGKKVRGKVYAGARLLNRKDIIIGEGSKVKPGAVLDAENGPIVLGRNVTIYPNAVIEGPAFVGDGSLIKIGAKIYESTSIGEVCKVGGEVEASILHSYSNKQHDGFLGHSYLGMWVNLGADTNNSDLKNNYSAVKVTINGRSVDSGSQFVGLIMGDHSKSGINTMFNTGTVVGVGCNVYGGGFPPKDIPSFCWGGSDGLVTYELDKCLDVARKVMARRKVELSPTEERLLREVFESTKAERERAVGQRGSSAT